MKVHMAMCICIYFQLLQAKIAICVDVCSEQQLMGVSSPSAAELCNDMELLCARALLLGAPAGITPSWEMGKNNGIFLYMLIFLKSHFSLKK